MTNANVGGISYDVAVNVQPKNAAQDLVKLAQALEQLRQQGSKLPSGFSGFGSLNKTLRDLETSLSRMRTVWSQAIADVDVAAKSYQQAAQRINQAVQSINTNPVVSGINAQGQASKSATVATSEHATALQAVGTVASAMAATGLNEFTAALEKQIQAHTLLAARNDNLLTVLQNVGSNAGHTRSELASLEKQVTNLGITTQSAREGLTLLARNELDLSRSTQLARIAQDSAVIAGTNSSDMFNRLVLSIQRLDTRLLRNAGIIVNLRNEYEQWALATGRTQNTLTAVEKQQILLDAVLRKGASTFGTYEAAMGDVYKQWTTMDRLIEQAHNKLGQQFIPEMETYVATMSAFYTWLEQANGLHPFIAGAETLGIAMGKIGSAGLYTTTALSSLSLLLSTLPRALAVTTAAAETSTAAWLGLKLAMGSVALLTNPVFLALAAGAAVASAAYVTMQAQQQQARREAEEWKSSMVSANLAILDFRDSVRTVEMLSVASADAAQGQAALTMAIGDLLRSAGPYEAQLRKVWLATNDVNKVLKEAYALNPELGQNDTDYFRRLEADAIKAEEKLKSINQRIAQPGNERSEDIAMMGSEADAGSLYLREQNRLAELQKEKAAAEVMVETAAQAKDKALDRDKRRIDKLLQLQETANQMAMRSEHDLQSAREKLSSDSNLAVIKSHEDRIEKLHASVVSEQDILTHAAAEMRTKLEQQNKTFDERKEKLEKAQAPQADIDKLEADRLKAVQSVQEEINQNVYRELQQRSNVLQALERGYEISRLQLEVEDRKLRDLQEQASLSRSAPSTAGIDFSDPTANANYETAKARFDEDQKFQLQQLETSQRMRRERERNAQTMRDYKKVLFGDHTREPELARKKADAEGLLTQRSSEFDSAESAAAKSPSDKLLQSKLIDARTARTAAQAQNDAAVAEYEQVVEGKMGMLRKRLQALERAEQLLTKDAHNPEWQRRIDQSKRAIEDYGRSITQVFKAEAQSVQESGLTERRIMEENVRALRESLEQRRQLERKYRDDIKKLRKDDTASSAEEARTKLAERYRERQDVDRFIRSQRVDNLNKQVPGVKDAIDLYNTYAEQVIHSTTKNQLDLLSSLFRDRLSQLQSNLRDEIGKAQGDVQAAKTPEDRQTAYQKLLQLQTQYSRLLPYLQRFEGQMTKDIATRTGELGKVEKARQREIDLVEQGIQLAQRELDLTIQKRKEYEKLVQLAEQEIGVRGESSAQKEVDLRFDQLYRAMEVVKDAGANTTPEMRKAVDDARDALDAAQDRLTKATNDLAAQRENAARQEAQATGSGMLSTAPSTPSGSTQSSTRSTNSTTPPGASGAGQRVPSDVMPAYRGNFRSWANEAKQWVRQSPQRDQVSRTREALDEARRVRLEAATTPKERADVERQYRQDVSGLDRRGRQRQYEQDKQDRKDRFQRFGAKGAQDPDNVLPPQKVPQQGDLLNKPQTNQEKATQEVSRGVDELKVTMAGFTAFGESQIKLGQDLVALAQEAAKDNQNNQRDADSMAQDISALRIV